MTKDSIPFDVFVERARARHGDTYTYNESSYQYLTELTEITCSIHGPFWQKASSHIIGTGCPLCGIIKANSRKRMTQEQFLEAAAKCPQVKQFKYTFEKAVYVNSSTKLEVTCPTHGSFWIRPNHLLSNHTGCAKCYGSDRRGKRKLPLSRVLEKATLVHKGKYDYSLITEDTYVDTSSKVWIRCRKHDHVFTKVMNVHVNGKEGCPICRREKRESMRWY